MGSNEFDFGSVFQYINSLPITAAYALVDDSSQTACINFTNNLRSKLGDIAQKISAAPNLRFEYFSISPHPVYKLIHSEQYKKKLESQGYKLNQQSFIRFKPRMGLDKLRATITVYLISPKGIQEIVGVFKKTSEAEEFYSLYYKDWCGLPVYAINKETREYFEKYRARGKRNFIESSVITTQID